MSDKYIEADNRYRTDLRFVCLYLCSLYKSVPLQGKLRNDLHLLMRPWDMYLQGRRATTCPMGEDCQAILS